MRSEETEFRGGPLDGRTLDVLLGPTGIPPRLYTVPVPGRGTLVYERVQLPHPRRRFLARWAYEYRPDGAPPRFPLPWRRRRVR